MVEQTQSLNILDEARQLVSLLEQNQEPDSQALNHIRNINSVREDFLFHEIGRLTRTIHDSLHNFDIRSFGAGDKSESTDVSMMQDASTRLHYVIEKTEAAANKALDMVENSLPTIEEIKQEAQNFTNVFQGASKVNAISLNDFIKGLEDKMSNLSSNLTEILMAQDFQDLTGQVIKWVIDLVQQIEKSLIDLVKISSSIDELAGLENNDSEVNLEVKEKDNLKAEGPLGDQDQIEVAQNQDDVDDLLSSLGF